MTSDIRIGVAGAGATGGYLAGILSAVGYDVTILTRGRSTSVIRERGITITKPDGESLVAEPARVVEAGDQVDPVDVTLFCVKAYDTAQAAKDVHNLVGEDGAILCLQNGVANEDELASVYGSERILSGVLYIGSQRVGPGVIRCSTQARVIFGPFTAASVATERLWEPLQNSLADAGISTTINRNVRAAKWQKFVFNCGLNPLTAITGKRLGEIRSRQAGRELYSRIIMEAIVAARAAGAPLADDALEQAEAVGDKMDISSSMAEDLEAGRGLELDAFTGHVLRLADQYGTAATVTRVIHGLLEVLDPKGAAGGGS